MKKAPSRAIEKGLTTQLINSVTPIPRQYCRTCPSAEKSILTSIGTIISQISAATGRLTVAISAAPIAWKAPGARRPRLMPATIQSPTQKLSVRSIKLMRLSYRGLRCSSACDPAPALIDNAFAVLLEKFTLLRRQKVDHELGRPAESDPFRRDHDRPVEQYGMRFERVEQGVLREIFVLEAQFAKNRFLVAQQCKQRHARAGRELAQQNPAGKGLQIFDNMRLDTGVTDKAERVARRAAVGVMVDGHIHRGHATSARRLDAPSVWPIPRRRALRVNWSRLFSGKFRNKEIRLS